MDIVLDRANKLLNDAHKKKVKVDRNACKSDKGQTKQDAVHVFSLTNNCFYCHKIFYNPKFLMKHLMRRHSENILAMYKKFLKDEPENNSSETKHLISFVEREFADLKNELKIIKQAVRKDNENDEAAEENKSDFQKNDYHVTKSKIVVTDVVNIHSDEIKILKDKVRFLETNFKNFHCKFQKLDDDLKSKVLFKEDLKEYEVIKEKILNIQELHFLELRENLAKDLQIMLAKQLNDNNNEWESQIYQLKQKMEKLEEIINLTRKQISSPDYLEKLEKRLEHQITHFLGRRKGYNRKARSKSKIRVSEAKLNCPFHDDKISDNKKFDNILSSVKRKQESRMPCISHKEINLLHEKLSQFGIPSNSSKMACAEYEEKMKLVNSEKDQYKEKYPRFSEVYNRTNMYADCLVYSELNKKPRKIRFSEPLISNVDPASVDDNIHNKTFPPMTSGNQSSISLRKEASYLEGDKARITSKCMKSEGFVFPTVGSSGDCFLNFQSNHNFSSSEISQSSIKSAFETKISSIDRDALCFMKADNINLRKCSSNSSFEMQNSSNVVENSHEQIDRPLDSKNLESGRVKNSTKDCNGDDTNDTESLESLSSWEN